MTSFYKKSVLNTLLAPRNNGDYQSSLRKGLIKKKDLISL